MNESRNDKQYTTTVFIYFNMVFLFKNNYIVIHTMNNSFFGELKSISDKNVDSKLEVREEHSRLKDEEYIKRDNAMTKAAGELYSQLLEDGLQEKLKNRAQDGYYDMLLFAVSLDPSMDNFASHEHGKPFVVTEYNDKTYTFTYRSLFWTPRWKDLFGSFNLSYRWNKPQTLLSVYISWGR